MTAQCMNFGGRVVGFFISTKRPPLTVKHLFLHPQECGLWPVCPQAGGGGRDVLRAGLFPKGWGVQGVQIVELSPSQLRGLRQ